MRHILWVLVLAFAALGANAFSADYESPRPDRLPPTDVLVKLQAGYVPDRRVRQSVRFIHPEVAEVTVSGGDAKAKAIEVRFRDSSDHFYGVWEAAHYNSGGRSGGIDNRGSRGPFMGTLVTRDVNYSSARAPFFMMRSGPRFYGIYVKSTALGSFSFEKAPSFSFNGSELQYDVIFGASYADILSRYNELAGPSVMPPLWAFGTGWWRDDAHEGFHGKVANAQENVLDDADQLQRLQIPAAWLWLDRPYGTGGNGWGNFDFDPSFPNPAQLIRGLNEKGYELLLWIANKNWEPSELWDEALKHGFLYEKKSGSAVDLKNPDAYSWFLKKLDRYVSLGIKGYKIDRGEEDEDAIPDEAKNSEIIEFSRLASQSMEKRHGSDHFDFARNLNDVGRRYSTVWGGDPQCTFGGLRTSITLGLRSGMIDFPMWGSDTGGLLCDHVPSEVFQRWLAFAAFSPMMEVAIGSKRTPWYEYDDAMVKTTRKFAELHHLLIPYTRSEMFAATQTGMPIMRALVLADPEDPWTADISDEYLYGSELLVAPVTQAGASSRSVYFPKGRWFSFSSGSPERPSVQEGGKSASIAAPLDSIPVFAREGAIIPMGDLLRANNHWTSDWAPHLDIHLFPSSRVASQFVYFDGKTTKEIRMRPSGADWVVDFEDLGTAGVVQVHCRGFDSIDKNGKRLVPEKDYRFDSTAGMAYIPFDGPTKLTIRHGVTL
ncbi:MAG: glycoside hydrolase family 31 protein [Oligoflexia bacterium]|nr:glycoside hydrolase family 31 protein [Oligoflexia bacterium]